MTEQQVTMSGPALLRHIANRMDLVDYEIAQGIRQMAASWEADLINATGLIADETLRAERAEARADELGRRLAAATMALQEAEESVDRLQATKKDLTAEIKGLYAEREAFHESFRRSYDEETKKLHAALERARALLKRTEYVYDSIYEGYYCETCGQGRGYGHRKDCELAAALAEGGRP